MCVWFSKWLKSSMSVWYKRSMSNAMWRRQPCDLTWCSVSKDSEDSEREKSAVRMSWGVWFQECETAWQRDVAGPDPLVKQATGPHIHEPCLSALLIHSSINHCSFLHTLDSWCAVWERMFSYVNHVIIVHFLVNLKVLFTGDSVHWMWFCVLKVITLGQGEVNRLKVYPMHPTSISGVEDMSTLAELHEAAILHNLFLRYQKDHIYVSFIQINTYACIDFSYFSV